MHLHPEGFWACACANFRLVNLCTCETSAGLQDSAGSTFYGEARHDRHYRADVDLSSRAAVLIIVPTSLPSGPQLRDAGRMQRVSNSKRQ